MQPEITIIRPTDRECAELHKGALVEIIWSGGNNGLYRVEKNEYGNSFAVNTIYYNNDGTEKNPESIQAMRFYNPISANNIEKITV